MLKYILFLLLMAKPFSILSQDHTRFTIMLDLGYKDDTKIIYKSYHDLLFKYYINTEYMWVPLFGDYEPHFNADVEVFRHNDCDSLFICSLNYTYVDKNNSIINNFKHLPDSKCIHGQLSELELLVNKFVKAKSTFKRTNKI